jgi:hypothetical protein
MYNKFAPCSFYFLISTIENFSLIYANKETLYFHK